MKVYILEVTFSFNGREDAIYPVVLQNRSETILVDCGYSGFMPMLENAAKLQGISLQDLTGIIITHPDIDHVGGLHELKRKYPSVKVYSSDTEERFISGKEKSLRLQQAESIFPALPEDQKPAALGFQEMLKNVKPVEVDFTFSADGLPAFFEDIQIIETPGHMPGHVSIYLKELKTLISADAVVIENGKFEIANPGFTLDLKKAVESVRVLLNYQIEEVICYHGGVMKGNIHHKLQELIARYPVS